MRNTLALLAVGCALFGAIAAQAQNLPISGVTPASLSFTPGVGGNFVFNGTITNNTAVTVDGVLPGSGIVPFTPNVTLDASNLPLLFSSLAPGQSYIGELFTLSIAPAQNDPFTLNFDIVGIDPAGANISTATGTFSLGVTSAVPEPGSMALMVSGGMLMLRRRRK